MKVSAFESENDKEEMMKREWDGHYGERWSNGVRDWVAGKKQELGSRSNSNWNCNIVHVHTYTNMFTNSTIIFPK